MYLLRLKDGVGDNIYCSVEVTDVLSKTEYEVGVDRNCSS